MLINGIGHVDGKYVKTIVDHVLPMHQRGPYLTNVIHIINHRLTYNVIVA